jgi:hypothetical protein
MVSWPESDGFVRITLLIIIVGMSSDVNVSQKSPEAFEFAAFPVMVQSNKRLQ